MGNDHFTPTVAAPGNSVPSYASLIGMDVSSVLRAVSGRLAGSYYGVHVLPIDSNGNIVDLGSATGVGDNTLTVTTAGTRVKFPSVACKRVIVQAHEQNAGTGVVGGATCVAALSGRRGIALFPSQSAVFAVSNLNLLHADSTEDGDKFHYSYES